LIKFFYCIHYIKDFDLKGEENKVKEAIDYCRLEKCIGHAVTYCQGCNKSAKYPGENILIFLKQIYDPRSEKNYDWVFATNVEDILLENIIVKLEASVVFNDLNIKMFARA